MRTGLVLADAGDGVVVDWTSLLTPQLLAVLGVIVLMLLVVALVAGWLAVRGFRRSTAPAALRRGLEQVRAHADTLTAPVEARREAAQLRQQLHEAHADTVRGLAAAHGRNPAMGEFPALVAALGQPADGWQQHLGALARESDDGTARAGLEAVLPEVQRLLTTMGQAHTALAGLRTETLAAGHAALEARVRDEAEALRTWGQTYRTLGQSP